MNRGTVTVLWDRTGKNTPNIISAASALVRQADHELFAGVVEVARAKAIEKVQSGAQNMRRAFLGTLVCASLSCMGVSVAQPYPTRPVTLIVPYGAGGPLDTLTRIV